MILNFPEEITYKQIYLKCLDEFKRISNLYDKKLTTCEINKKYFYEKYAPTE